MASWTTKGLKEYILELEKVDASSGGVCGRAIYEGAAVMANAIRSATSSLPTYNGRSPKGQMIDGISETQKADLLASLNITKARNDGDFRNVRIGFEGYNRLKSKKYPKGQPNQLIARAVNSGTSFRKKTGFVTKTINANKQNVINTMKTVYEEELRKRKG